MVSKKWFTFALSLAFCNWILASSHRLSCKCGTALPALSNRCRSIRQYSLSSSRHFEGDIPITVTVEAHCLCFTVFLNSKKKNLYKDQTDNSFFLPTSPRLSSKIWKSCQVQGLIVGGGRAKWPIYHSYWLDFSMKLPLCLFCLFLLTLLFSDSFPSLS